MGVHDSWYSERELEGNNPWFNLLKIAEKMADVNDAEYGKYTKARHHSGIEGVLAKFKTVTKLDLPKSEESEKNIEELKLAISKFRSRKNMTDSAGAILSDIFSKKY